MDGATLRRIRRAHGLTQAAVGARFGYVPRAVGGWEHGLAPVPPVVAAWAASLPAPPPPLDGPGLLAFRAAHGWTQRQVATACGVSRPGYRKWEEGRAAIPGRVAAWVATFPPVPVCTGYAPYARANLRQWLRRHAMTLREFAEFCGVTEWTVAHWLHGPQPVPAAVVAWMRAGCPPAWRWAPPGAPLNAMARRGKRPDEPSHHRPAPHRRRGGSRPAPARR